MTPTPTVAVIGAGISGLTTLKMLDDYGIEAVGFEASDRIGGNWAFDNPNGSSSAYRSLHIDTSKHQLSFRDFPMPEEFPDFPHHSQIKQYLDDYAEAFDLLRRIEFENRVLHAERLEGGGWELTTERTGTRRFDALVVGNGHHWDPRFGDFPGEFTGEMIHSHAYVDPWDPLELLDKRILVVGLGNSAADIAVELSSKVMRNEVVISTRSGAWIVPKYIAGKPADKYFATFPFLPYSWQRKAIQAMQPMSAGRPESYGLPKPNHKFFEAHPTQSVELPLRLGSGDITAKGNIARFEGRTVHFEDGTAQEFDVVIQATGYNTSFPFFDPEFLSADAHNHVPLYKRMFSPGIDDLVMVGFAQSTPTLFPFVEAQARLAAAWAAGLYRTPDRAEMEQVIVADEKKYIGHMLDTPRHQQQVDYFLYEHDLRTREIPEGRERAARSGGMIRTAAHA
ncbi:NAD(P)-binding domain-containing protein [Dietzia sp. CQ4]|uniref:flavin-containing monooxygenase n=1 Tax=Dietzia TaxID=37914 RepID=UPI0015F9B5D0|nr:MULTISPECIES: NAD(P)-binding domain-containing protein [Dietzia]MBB1035572.1 NAD(P)-binding domain-containing protein [Dietzia sp. CQ4]MBB1039284.1 NAD(P)-binding domain-containing protein [Dietzia natronolimnaea]MBB1054924.1 NAD(P)-binding domain-containing protein [Dietzia sp. B44]